MRDEHPFRILDTNPIVTPRTITCPPPVANKKQRCQEPYLWLSACLTPTSRSRFPLPLWRPGLTGLRIRAQRPKHIAPDLINRANELHPLPLRRFFDETPEAAVGEIGLDKGSHGKTIDFGEQVEVFQRPLELAKELERPVSVHCVRAFGDLLEVLKQTGPFPAGVLLHSYMGSSEMVSGLANLGCYFSLSGFLIGMKSTKAKQLLKSIPLDRILLETDAPEALPKLDNVSVSPVPVHSSDADTAKRLIDSESQAANASNESLNHPENIHIVLKYVASLLKMPESELAKLSYKNATKLFSYPGSKVQHEAEAI